MDIAQLVTVLTQLGLAGAAWRLATKIDKRQIEHEKVDQEFQMEIRAQIATMPCIVGK
jgi:UDP-N-acetylglucosamine enolpyruvyl transferase